MKQLKKPFHMNRKPLSAAVLGGIVAISAPNVLLAEDGANPWAASKTFSQGQPLRLAACTPCGAKKACNPCNPCAVKKAACSPCNPCNPCAVKKAACGACNPCNPCAVKKKNPCNPCNPCKTS